MAGVAFEEFSAPPGSELALPPLFGGNILESELETEVEFVDGAGLGGDPHPRHGGDDDEEEEEEGRRQREVARRKLQALGRRCREIEQVNERVLSRLQQVQRITRRLQQERRFLMKVLDSHGDEYRRGQLTILLQDEAGGSTDAPTPGNAENEPPDKEPNRGAPAPPAPPSPPPEPPSTKRRRRPGREEKGGGGRRGGGAAALLPPETFPTQLKGEEEELGPSPAWAPPSPPEKLLRFPKFSSPGGCNDFD
ncbi:TCF3 fusion partner [Grus japonensis]|uniref:TCF3 fusion partner n=1 Tax=Grus japonensis TaxID=30415 RepID=A0ABC9XWG6_GRUJA